MEVDRLAESIDVASKALGLASALSIKKGLFGRLKPTHRQLGWAYGFCDGYAQSVGLQEDRDFILFISMIFEQVFGAKGLNYFNRIARNQQEYLAPMMEGGTAHHAWVSEGTPPLMPLS